MANVISPPGLMGSSAKEITGFDSMAQAMEALKVGVPGFMSAMAGKGMETVMHVVRWTSGSVTYYGTGTGHGLFEGPENIGLGSTIISCWCTESGSVRVPNLTLVGTANRAVRLYFNGTPFVFNYLSTSGANKNYSASSAGMSSSWLAALKANVGKAVPIRVEYT